MNVQENKPQESRHSPIERFVIRLAIVFLGLLAFCIGFVCCCTGTGFAFLIANTTNDAFLYVAIGIGIFGGLTAFILVLKGLWPRS